MQPAALVPRQRGADDEVGDLDQIAQFDEIGGHAEVGIIIAHFLAQHVDPVLGPLEPLGGADDADIVPHEAADLAPGLGDHHFLVAVGDPAFVPAADGGNVGQIVPVGSDMLRRRLAEHQAFEQAVGGQAIGAVQPRLGDLPGGIEPRPRRCSR